MNIFSEKNVSDLAFVALGVFLVYYGVRGIILREAALTGRSFMPFFILKGKLAIFYGITLIVAGASLLYLAILIHF